MAKHNRKTATNMRQILEKESISMIRARRIHNDKEKEPFWVEIGDKTAELTTLDKLMPVVGSTNSSLEGDREKENKRKKSTDKFQKVIEYTPLSELSSIVYGGVPDLKQKKSKMDSIRQIVKSITR